MLYRRQTDVTPIGFDVDFTANMMNGIRDFAKARYPNHRCYIEDIYSMPDDPKKGEDRVDIYLDFQIEEVKDETTYVSDAFRQKVFYINGNVIDCNEYRELLKENENGRR